MPLTENDSFLGITSVVELLSAHRLIVKIGSSLIGDPGTGEIRLPWLETLIEDVARLFARGQQVIIVTSGAVAVGSCHFKQVDTPLQVEEKQAAAAIGQVRLMLAYEKTLKRHGLSLGQILLTNEDVGSQHRCLKTRSILQQLLKVGAVPVINENDTTATGETCLGDNDQLSAKVAQIINADVLILLSNVDGLFTEDPHNNSFARLVPEVRCITPEIEAMAGPSPARHSSGGMVTKLMAARIAMDAGCDMIIAEGKKSHPLTAIENGAPSTWFIPLARDRAGRDARANHLRQT